MSDHSPVRVIIAVCVTNIPGEIGYRVTKLGEMFSRSVLNRPLQREMSATVRFDYAHFLEGFDSEEPVTKHFVYDFNVNGAITRSSLKDIPHPYYIATWEAGDTVCFIKRKSVSNSPGVIDRTSFLPWGGPGYCAFLAEHETLLTSI
ncbi:hypothetical protein EJ05DRAFT_509837 [Pseudovirgaria hyperparasitica]|uniref:Uncharacterized protein n=1 Tax=Pseudovirgaria hyperparasitica TaxID=470096 RepID=A0A6A6WCX7_9PEZI|nr:uncharacterized protein EJ05DRAFT_509837 [Pseudovirgaria hyperparasitica]KAF2758961.1 hypothetical protein EJ05DRAFT_509837 [Pseudovirgaria hyperparasitica]